MRHAVLTMVAAAALTFAVSGQTVWYVDDDAPLGGDGASWETAYRFLQDALASTDGGFETEIWIAQGTYQPDRDEANPDGSGERTAVFDVNDGAHLVGGYLGLSAGDGESPDQRDPNAYHTILSADLLGDDGPDFAGNEENAHCVVFASAARLEGLTIRGANGGPGNPEPWYGWGAGVAGSDIELVECTLRTNTSLYAGAVEAYGGMTAVDCVFTGNAAGRYGGAIYTLGNGEVTLTDCLLSENVAARGGGAIAAFYSGNVIRAIGCSFVRNRVTGPASEPGYAVYGGAAWVFCDSAIFLDCRFTGNVVTNLDPTGLAGGGGLVLVAPGTVMNCLFVGNAAALAGALMVEDVEASVINCTVVANASFGVAVDTYDEPGLIVNSIVANNTFYQIDPELIVRYSCVEGGYPGDGNIDAAPMFVHDPHPGADGIWGTEDDDYGDLRLLAGSPGLDAGFNPIVPQDALDRDGDGDVSERIPLDLGGGPRFCADEVDFDPGCGVPVIVDMGPYEHPFDPVETMVFADVDGDGSVGTTDLVQLILDWGVCAGCCLSDLDVSGAVDAWDLYLLIVHWG